MQQHDSLGGPFRGSPVWWQATAIPEQAKESEPRQEEAAPKQPGSIRWDLVRRIKQEIAQGTYDSSEKWDAALERFLERLD